MESQRSGFKIWYALSLAFQLGFIIIAPIGGFLLAGLWADRHFHTSPLFILLGTALGAGITAYEVYQMLAPLI